MTLTTDVFSGYMIWGFVHKVKRSAIPDILHDRLKVLEKQICFCDLADLAQWSLACSSDKLQICGTVPCILLGQNYSVRINPKED